MTSPMYRIMDPDDVAMALDWARDEGWNPGLEDPEAFHASDPDGFFLAEVDGAPAAVISVVNHSDDLAFLGLYITHPDVRGQGIGLSLWQRALDHAGDRTIGLDGVPDQQDNYRKSGFVLTGETYRYSGSVEAMASDRIRPATPEDRIALTELEARANGYAKPAFMSAWLEPTRTRRTVVMVEDGAPVGFVTIRTCAAGHKIGPLVARSAAEAEELIRAAGLAASADEVIVDVPDDCPELRGRCEALGMAVSFNTARMYRGTPPQPGQGCRGIATLELG